MKRFLVAQQRNRRCQRTWLVATDCGTFDESCLTEVCATSFAGFRIKEELVGVGGKTVVGRTPNVTGALVINEKLINSEQISR